MQVRRSEVAALSRLLGDPQEDLAILGEGNVSGRCDEKSFWIKASGRTLATLTEDHLVQVSFEPFERLPESMSDAEVRELLARSRVEAVESMPSVETFMHAYLLGLPDVNFVGHTHPTPLISLLALEMAPHIAQSRIFPDEIVCCGPETAFVGYEDPGISLAKAIRVSVESYMSRWDQVPKTIWLANHGLIATGRTCGEVESASRMSVKSARVWLGALGTNHPIHCLSEDNVRRIHNRPDEHYRQRILATLSGREGL